MSPLAFPAFTGKRVLIAGASTGIGLATAVILARSGAHVCINSRSKDRCEAALRELSGEGHSYVTGNLNEVEECKRVVGEAVALLGGLDVLVHSGGGGFEFFSLPSLEIHTAQYQANCLSSVALLDAAAPELKKSKGNAVFVSSQSARFAFPPHEAYTMSKLALEAFVRTRAFAYAEDGVRVNVMAPGVIDTPPHDVIATMLGKTKEDHLAHVAATQVPMRRVGAASEAGAAVAFLASEAASYITGVVLAVDGGVILGDWANKQ